MMSVSSREKSLNIVRTSLSVTDQSQENTGTPLSMHMSPMFDFSSTPPTDYVPSLSLSEVEPTFRSSQGTGPGSGIDKEGNNMLKAATSTAAARQSQSQKLIKSVANIDSADQETVVDEENHLTLPRSVLVKQQPPHLRGRGKAKAFVKGDTSNNDLAPKPRGRPRKNAKNTEPETEDNGNGSADSPLSDAQSRELADVVGSLISLSQERFNYGSLPANCFNNIANAVNPAKTDAATLANNLIGTQVTQGEGDITLSQIQAVTSLPGFNGFTQDSAGSENELFIASHVMNNPRLAISNALQPLPAHDASEKSLRSPANNRRNQSTTTQEPSSNLSSDGGARSDDGLPELGNFGNGKTANRKRRREVKTEPISMFENSAKVLASSYLLNDEEDGDEEDNEEDKPKKRVKRKPAQTKEERERRKRERNRVLAKESRERKKMNALSLNEQNEALREENLRFRNLVNRLNVELAEAKQKTLELSQRYAVLEQKMQAMHDFSRNI